MRRQAASARPGRRRRAIDAADPARRRPAARSATAVGAAARRISSSCACPIVRCRSSARITASTEAGGSSATTPTRASTRGRSARSPTTMSSPSSSSGSGRSFAGVGLIGLAVRRSTRLGRSRPRSAARLAIAPRSGRCPFGRSPPFLVSQRALTFASPSGDRLDPLSDTLRGRHAAPPINGWVPHDRTPTRRPHRVGHRRSRLRPAPRRKDRDDRVTSRSATATISRSRTRRASRASARRSPTGPSSSTTTPGSRTRSRSSPTAPPSSASETSGRGRRCPSWRARRCCSSSSAASTPCRSASTAPTSTRSSKPSFGSRRASAASTSRTSPRRAASRSSAGCRSGSTSRSSTTTSTARRSSCSRRCATPWPSPARQIESARVVVSGAGAAGVAITEILQRAGVARHRRRRQPGGHRDEPRRPHASQGRARRRPRIRADIAGDVDDALRRRRRVHRRQRRHGRGGGHRADGAGRDRVRTRQSRARDPPRVAARHAAVVATGRSDFPNQINNVLAFPGIFRGALDARARQITEAMKLAAADALAGLVAGSLRDDYVIPSCSTQRVGPTVAEAVARAT